MLAAASLLRWNRSSYFVFLSLSLPNFTVGGAKNGKEEEEEEEEEEEKALFPFRKKKERKRERKIHYAKLIDSFLSLPPLLRPLSPFPC